MAPVEAAAAEEVVGGETAPREMVAEEDSSELLGIDNRSLNLDFLGTPVHDAKIELSLLHHLKRVNNQYV